MWLIVRQNMLRASPRNSRSPNDRFSAQSGFVAVSSVKPGHVISARALAGLASPRPSKTSNSALHRDTLSSARLT
jgi:hypothetical protein